MRDHDDPSLSWWYNYGDDDYDGYDFHGPTDPKKRHYTQSNIVNSDKAIEISKELIDIKEAIKELQEKERNIKKRLAKIIPNFHWVNVENEYIVAKEAFKQQTKFNRTKVLTFLNKKFGKNVSKAVAAEFSPSTINYQTIFVKKNYLAKKSSYNTVDDDDPF